MPNNSFKPTQLRGGNVLRLGRSHFAAAKPVGLTQALGSTIIELRSMKEIYQGVFCNHAIEPGALDPCALILIAHIDRARREQKEQIFYCHFGCLQDKSATHHGNFYIAEPDFPTVGQASAG